LINFHFQFQFPIQIQSKSFLEVFFALLSSLKNSDASSAVSPLIAGLILSCPYFILASISDAPNPRWRICHDAPMLRPIISHSSGLLSHKIGSYIRLAGWEGGAGCGCGWFLGGGCQGGIAQFSTFSIVLIVVVFIFIVIVVGFIFVGGVGMSSLP